jgi:uncharacterized protein
LAQRNYANLLFDGIHVKKDEQAAMALYLKAAEGGEPVAMNNYGFYLATGVGGKKDVKTGVQWLEKGIAAGDPTAPTSLGELYDGGKVLTFDATKAATFFLKGLERKDESAMAALIEKSGSGLQPQTRKAITRQLKRDGQKITISSRNFNETVLDVLKKYPK